jgi:hypothetical protein
LPSSTLPTASVEGSEMSISPCTTTGYSPNAMSAKMTNEVADDRRLTGSRK